MGSSTSKSKEDYGIHEFYGIDLHGASIGLSFIVFMTVMLLLFCCCAFSKPCRRRVFGFPRRIHHETAHPDDEHQELKSIQHQYKRCDNEWGVPKPWMPMPYMAPMTHMKMTTPPHMMPMPHWMPHLPVAHQPPHLPIGLQQPTAPSATIEELPRAEALTGQNKKKADNGPTSI